MMISANQIEQILKEKLNVHFISVEDQSHLHVGHPGVQESGGGHFYAHIVSDNFLSKSLIQRHRLVNQSLSSYFQNGIHALNIKAQTVREYQGKEVS